MDIISIATEILIECRRSLKHTYIYGYFLSGEKQKKLFEYLQEDLEKNTEELSFLLEKNFNDYNKEKILKTSNDAKKRLENLISGLLNKE